MIALIIARPGMLRDGLSGLLSAMPEIKMVAVTANLESALESVAGSCPSIVVLETYGIDAKYLEQVQELKALCPQARIISLTEALKEIQACEKGTVDAVLREGVRPSKLVETVSELLESAFAAEPQA